MFQHIPVPEFFDVIKKVPKGTKGAVLAYGAHENEYFVLNDETIAEGGFMLESPASPDVNTGEFEAMSEKGDVLGIYVGHDHNNSFVVKYKGVDLGYTQGAGFNVYGPGETGECESLSSTRLHLANTKPIPRRSKNFAEQR